MFGRARLKLTVFYSGIVLLIVALFSMTSLVLLHMDLSTESQLSPEGDHYMVPMDESTQDSRRTYMALAIIDPVLVLMSIGAGWLLAGRTLAPIHENMKRQQRFLSEQKRFVSDAAHELRTPLSIMKTGLETIEAGAPPSSEDYRHLNHEMRKEIERIVNLTNDLLYLSRSELAAEAAEKMDIDLSVVCAANLKLIQTYASQNGVLLKEQIEPGVHFPGNEDQVGRLVLNLLKNAIDYNREGGEALLRLATRGGAIVLEISDTGIGIDDASIGHIFERFYKVDDSRARSNSGTGLGLAIVKTIVQAHNGDVSVRSQPGEGTTVTVTFDPSLRNSIS